MPYRYKKKGEQAANGGGRPGYWKPEYAKQAYQLALLGATNRDLCEFFGLKRNVIEYWMVNKPEFGDAVRRGKIVADMRVAESLYNRAVGYEYTEKEEIKNRAGEVVKTKIVKKQMPSDIKACMYWLQTRRKEFWINPNKAEVNVTYGGGVDLRFIQKQLQDSQKYSLEDLKNGFHGAVAQLALNETNPGDN